MDIVDRYIRQAQDHIARSHIDGAIGVLQQALSEDPDEEHAHALLAICLLNKHRLHAANHEAKIALSLDSSNELANYANALIEMARQKFKNAEAHIEFLLQNNPADPDYYRLKASLYELTNRNSKIKSLLDKALSLDPDNPETLAYLSRHYLENNDLPLARQHAQMALSIEPENEDALIAMGHVMLEKNEIDQAREHAISALRNNPNSTSALYLMAAIKTKSNPFLGLWWRYNAWMVKLGTTKSILVLLFAFVCYRLGELIAGDMGRPDIADIISYIWLAIVIYTFIGPAIFKKSLAKELKGVTLRDDF